MDTSTNLLILEMGKPKETRASREFAFVNALPPAPPMFSHLVGLPPLEGEQFLKVRAGPFRTSPASSGARVRRGGCAAGIPSASRGDLQELELPAGSTCLPGAAPSPPQASALCSLGPGGTAP